MARQTAVVHGSIPALLWKRVAAFVVDILVLDFTVFAPFRRIFAKAFPDFAMLRMAMEGHITFSGSLAFAAVSMATLAMLYFTLCESIVGQTVGKMLFRLRVAGIASPPGFWRCFIRSLFLLPVFPFIAFWLIDPLYMFFTRSSQRLLERLSRTATVESSPFTFKISTVS
ncbi:MAG TPA: RDD family protein [Candidatus Nanoarchaeia archaeon]|nr:RDD family protein [Candidatus Nanoarchaeia archaeon]